MTDHLTVFERIETLPSSTAQYGKSSGTTEYKKIMHCVIAYLFNLFIYYLNKLCFLHIINKKYNIYCWKKL